VSLVMRSAAAILSLDNPVFRLYVLAAAIMSE
jgi:hypothetical protein